MEKIRIQLRVNGEPRELLAPPHRALTLLEVLLEEHVASVVSSGRAALPAGSGAP